MFNLNEAATWTIPDLLKNQEFRAFCAGLYNSIHTRSRQSGNAFFDQELQHFRGIYAGSTAVQGAKTQSVATTFINIMFYGTSIAPVPKAQAYIIPKGGEVKLKISPYGELALRIDSGIIQDIMGPFLVHEGDAIETINGKVHHIGRNKTTKIIGVWVRIIKHNGVEDDKYFSMEQMQTYRKKSAQPDGLPWTGGVDGQPTLGMLEAKTILHAFDTYPRMKLNDSVERTTDDDQDRETIYANAMGDITAPVEQKAEPQPEPVQQKAPEPPTPETKPTISSSIPTFF